MAMSGGRQEEQLVDVYIIVQISSVYDVLMHITLLDSWPDDKMGRTDFRLKPSPESAHDRFV